MLATIGLYFLFFNLDVEKFIILVNNVEWAEVSNVTSTYIIRGLTPNKHYSIIVRKVFTNTTYIDSVGIHKTVKTVYSGGTTDPVEFDEGFNTLFGYGENIQLDTRYNFQQATEYGQDVDKIYMIPSGYDVNLPFTNLVLVKKTDGTFHTIGRNTSNNLRGIIPFNSDLTVNEYQLVPNAFLNHFEPL